MKKANWRKEPDLHGAAASRGCAFDLHRHPTNQDTSTVRTPLTYQNSYLKPSGFVFALAEIVWFLKSLL